MTKSKARYFIKGATLEPVTKKDFFRRRDQEINDTHVSKKHLIDKKQFTKQQLDSYERQGLLTPLKHKGKIFFPKAQLLTIIESEHSQQKLLF